MVNNKKAPKEKKIARAAQQRYTVSQQQADAKTILGTGFGVFAAFFLWLLGGTAVLLEQTGFSGGLAEFGIIVLVYLFFGTIFNLTFPAAGAQALLPPWVLEVWHKIHPAED